MPDSSFDPIFCPLETGDTIEFNSIEFDNEDAYTQMHAMIQWTAKSYNPEIEITENLINDPEIEINAIAGDSMHVNRSKSCNENHKLDSCVDNQKIGGGNYNYRSLARKILTRMKTLQKNEWIIIMLCLIIVLPWTLWMMWFILPWGLLGVVVMHNTHNWVYDKFFNLFNDDVENEAPTPVEKIKNGKELIMNTFLENKDRVFEMNKMGLTDNMSNMSEKSMASKLFVETAIEILKIDKKENIDIKTDINIIEKELYSEDMLDIKSSKPRISVMACLEGVSLFVLADSGATSTAVSRFTVSFIEEKIGRRLPRLNKKASYRVFGHTASVTNGEVVVMNVSIGEEVKTARCPFIVDESKDGLYGLIGTNVMEYFGFVLDVGRGRAYIRLKEDGLEGILPKEELMIIPGANLKLLEETVIMEQQLLSVPVKVDGQLPKSSSGLYACTSEFNVLEGLDVKGMVFNETGKNSDMMLRIENKSDIPMKFKSGTNMGEINEYNPAIFKLTPQPRVAGSYGKRTAYKAKCICDLRRDRETCLIYFTNRLYFHAQEHQVTAGLVPLKTIEKVSGNYRNEKGILYVRPSKNGSYVFNWKELQKIVTKNVRILFSFRENITEDHEKFILNLRNKSIDVHIYVVKNFGDCFGCLSLSNFECPDLFRDVKGTEIYIMDSGTQLENLHRVKAETSPIIELVYGYYTNVHLYRSRKALQIKVHVTDWHKRYHKYRIEAIMAHLLFQLSILRAPNQVSVFTSWSDLGSYESRQILNALKLSSPWESDPNFELKSLDTRDVEAPMAMRNCNCNMCSRLKYFKPCPVQQAMLNFKGKIDDNLIGSRIKIDAREIACLQATAEFNEVVEKTEEDYIKIIESTPDYKLNVPPHTDDLPSWEGHEHIRDKFYHDEFAIPDAQELKDSYHQPVNWRLIIKTEQLPTDPKLLKLIEAVLDRFNDMFTANKASWRYFNCEPLDAEFTSNEIYVAKSFGMNKEKEYILDLKVLALYEAGFLYEILSEHPEYITNKLQGFLTIHNSEGRRNEILKQKVDGEEDAEIKKGDDVVDLDPNDYRLIVNGKPSNKYIKHPERYKEHMPDMHTILNKIGAYNSFITMDISKAYRSLPASERLQRRFAFKCDTSLLRGRVWAFKSVPDGVSLAPSFISYIINNALKPFRHTMPRDSDCFVFIDDIIIAARSPETCIEAWSIVMEALEKLNVLISASKMTVLKNDFQFLGWRIWYDDVEGAVRRSVPEARKNCFKRMKAPRSKRDIQGIYGAAGFVAPASPSMDLHISQVMDTLRLTKKQHEKFELSDIQLRAFDRMLVLLDNLQDLFALDPRKTIYHLSDASFNGLGSLLYQCGKNNSRQPIAYFSKRFPTIITTQRSSVFKEILALWWSVEHHRKTLEICKQAILVVDISSVVSMLRAHISPTDKQLARISSYIFAWGFNFMLKQSCGYNLVVADFLSRIYEEPVTETGVPICQKDIDLDQFFKDYADKLPKDWTTPGGKGIFNFEDLITHTTVELLNDSRISDSVRQKRLMGLLENIDDRFHPAVLKFLPKDNPLVDTSISKNFKGGEQDEINVCVVEICKPTVLKQVRDIEILAMTDQKKTVKELSPPVTNALTITYLVELQRREESTAKVINHLLTYKPENQHHKIKTRFKLLDTQLLVTKKDYKEPYTPKNVRIYLGPLAALYAVAYMHLSAGHLGQKKLARMFNATFKCYQSTSIVKTIVQACLGCNIYRYPNVILSPPGRLPREVEYAGQMFYIDIVKLDTTDVIACRDSYSGYVWLTPISSHKSVDVVDALKYIFTISLIPDKIKCDNESAFATPSFREEMQAWGIKEVIYSTANHSQSNSFIEQFFAKLRALLWLNKKSFRRKNDKDVLYCSLAQLNNLPNWSLAKYYSGKVPPSPANLVFGTAPKYDILGNYLDHLNAEDTIKYHEKYKQLMDEFEREKDEHHKNKGPDKYSAGEKVVPGVLVFLRNPLSKHKYGRGNPYYLTEIYEVLRRDMRVVTVQKLFGRTRKNEKVSIHDVRIVPDRHLIKLLPREVQEVLTLKETNEELKNLKQTPIQLVERLSPVTDHNLRSQKNKVKSATETTPAIKDPLWAESDNEDDESIFPTYGDELDDIQKKNNVPFDPNTAMDDEEYDVDDGGSVASGGSIQDADNDFDEAMDVDEPVETGTGEEEKMEVDDDVPEENADISKKNLDNAETGNKTDTGVVRDTEDRRGKKRAIGFDEERLEHYFYKDNPVNKSLSRNKFQKTMGKIFGNGSPLKSFKNEAENRNYTMPTPILTSSPKKEGKGTPDKNNTFFNPSPILDTPKTPVIAGKYRDKVNDSDEKGESTFQKSLNEDLARDAGKNSPPSSTKKDKTVASGEVGSISKKLKNLDTSTKPKVVKRKLDFEDDLEYQEKAKERQGRSTRYVKPVRYRND